MSSPLHGGPAFPSLRALVNNSGSRTERFDATNSGGMTLRDYFAGQALVALIAKLPVMVEDDSRSILPTEVRVSKHEADAVQAGAVTAAYQYADLMLKAREAK
jgi:hypothetical protein